MEDKVIIKLDGIETEYERDKATKHFTKLYEEEENEYSQRKQRLCYIVAWLRRKDVNYINADSLYC